MTRELELWDFLLRHLGLDQNVLLLVVATSSGSSPGRRGFKMAVTLQDLCGSIGGGVMEVNLVEKARAILSVPPESPPPAGGALPSADRGIVSQQVHRKGAKDSSGMICSGRQTVIFRLLTPEDAGTIHVIIDSINNRQPNSLTITPSQFSVAPSRNDSPDFTFESTGNGFQFTERLGPKNELFIVGGGHCALALSEQMSGMDFYIRLFDDRPELNTISKNTFASEKHLIESYEQIAEKIPGGPNAYVVVMTLGFASDEIVIRELLGKTLKYFGVLGSRAKMAQLLTKLKKQGYPKEKLDRIRTPIGLPINSQTPREIAVSIAAEIISVKNSL